VISWPRATKLFYGFVNAVEGGNWRFLSRQVELNPTTAH